MNNTLCLAVFTALVFFNDLEWQFSAGKEHSVNMVDLLTMNTNSIYLATILPETTVS